MEGKVNWQKTRILATQLILVIRLGLDVTSGTMEEYLDFVEGNNIDGLDVVLEGGDVFFQKISGDLVVFDNTRDLKKILEKSLEDVFLPGVS